MNRKVKALLIWVVIAVLMIIPIVVAAMSPFMVGRDSAYIVGGMAGVLALSFLLLQPLLAVDYLPAVRHGRRWHRLVGCLLVLAVLMHVGGLYLTSPADVIDALLLLAPTPFSVYGVIGLWALILTVLLVAIRPYLGWRPLWWRIVHNGLALIVVVASIVHALLIEGTMGRVSKVLLCLSVLVVSVVVVIYVRIIRHNFKPRQYRKPSQ